MGTATMAPTKSERVDDWIKWHSEPQFKTDLWFLVAG